jgi:hypothetical protein
MRPLRLLLVTTALIIGSAALASAQSWGYADRDGYYRGDRAVQNARSFGYQDGFADGKNDWYTGHSFRPTHDPNFKHADRGFYGSIDRNYYKQLYREAYEEGYERGYNGRDRGAYRRY